MIDVRNKRALVVGLGRSGRAAAFLLRRQGAIVTVTDIKPPAAFGASLSGLLAEKIGLALGLQPIELFLASDLVVVSPGVPWELPQLAAARERGIPVLPEVEVAGWYMDAPIVGVTGSNGKTTTTTLLGKMLEASGFSTFVGGNIGVALSTAVESVKSGSIVVAELSSFQLEAIREFRPHVAVLLNISPNHLDRHPTFEAYAQAKRQIFRNQRADDFAVLNADDPWVRSLGPALVSRKVFFSRVEQIPCGLFVSNGNIVYRTGHLQRVLLETKEVRLRGSFNLEDVLGAAAAACVLGADFDAVRKAVREFKGVEHRLEYVRDVCGVEFYNNSKATSVDATAKSLAAFERGVHLIMGGKDKGAPYAPLRPLLKDRVREVLLIGAAADRIAQELSGAVELVQAGNLETAVPEAFQRARPGDVVLLAPACSSFDQFQDYEERGRVFKELVGQLAQDLKSGTAEWRWKKREARRWTADASARVQAAPAVPDHAQAQPPASSGQEAAQVIAKPEVETPASAVEDQQLAAPAFSRQEVPQVAAEPEVETPAAEVEDEQPATPAFSRQEVPQVIAEPELETPAEKLEDKQHAAPAEDHAEPLVDTAPPAEPPIRELTLVYETNADEYFPADVELEEDYSDRSETRHLGTPATPERNEGAPLPYEGRFEEQGPPAGKSTEVDNFQTSTIEEEPSPKLAEEKKPKSTDRTDSAQLRLPRMD
jgi:UDP-N-acetylmuramoylalanine--D-glutamate ligase